jgi:hypothetical protein
MSGEKVFRWVMFFGIILILGLGFATVIELADYSRHDLMDKPRTARLHLP